MLCVGGLCYHTDIVMYIMCIGNIGMIQLYLKSQDTGTAHGCVCVCVRTCAYSLCVYNGTIATILYVCIC